MNAYGKNSAKRPLATRTLTSVSVSLDSIKIPARRRSSCSSNSRKTQRVSRYTSLARDKDLVTERDASFVVLLLKMMPLDVRSSLQYQPLSKGSQRLDPLCWNRHESINAFFFSEQRLNPVGSFTLAHSYRKLTIRVVVVVLAM